MGKSAAGETSPFFVHGMKKFCARRGGLGKAPAASRVKPRAGAAAQGYDYARQGGTRGAAGGSEHEEAPPERGWDSSHIRTELRAELMLRVKLIQGLVFPV